MRPEIREEMQHLLSALCDREISDPEFARLETLMSADAECRKIYLDYMDMHARLLSNAPALGNASSGMPKESTAAPRGIPVAQGAAVPAQRGGWLNGALRQSMLVAGTLAASILLQVFWQEIHTTELPADIVPQVQKLPPERKTIPYIATLVQTADCVWENPREKWQDGARLSSGKFRLAKGISSIRLDSGPELIVQGPASVNLDSGTMATVLAGRVVFRSTDAEVPFELRTPTSTLVDVGTEYAISVDADTEEVHVFEGEVDRIAKAGIGKGQAELLKAGDARRYEKVAGAVMPAQLDPKGFVRQVVEPGHPGPDPAFGLLAYEGFDYANPFTLQSGKASGGRGWAGPWKLGLTRPPFKGSPLNVKEGLSRPSGPSVGGSLDFVGAVHCYRNLAEPIRLDTDGVYYLSFLVRRFERSGDPTNVLCMRLLTNADYKQQDHADFRKRLNIGLKGPSQLYASYLHMAAHTSLPLNHGTTYLLVAKIAASRSKADQLFVRVYGPDEPVGAEETGAWSLLSSPFRSDQIFEWIEVQINSKTRKAVDEIRVGTTWSSVTAPWMAAAKNGDIRS